MLEQGVRSIQKKNPGEKVLDPLTLKLPWDKKWESHYPTGVEGDSSTRRIVIDGSNVARAHGKVGEIKRKHNQTEVFSILGIKIAVEEFWRMGCRKVTVFLPPSRQGNHGTPRIPESERKLQRQMEDQDIIKYTPGRRIEGRFKQSYDDIFIVQMAADEEGVIVSNDQFRDLIDTSDAFRDTINNRLLP